MVWFVIHHTFEFKLDIRAWNTTEPSTTKCVSYCSPRKCLSLFDDRSAYDVGGNRYGDRIASMIPFLLRRKGIFRRFAYLSFLIRASDGRKVYRMRGDPVYTCQPDMLFIETSIGVLAWKYRTAIPAMYVHSIDIHVYVRTIQSVLSHGPTGWTFDPRMLIDRIVYLFRSMGCPRIFKFIARLFGYLAPYNEYPICYYARKLSIEICLPSTPLSILNIAYHMEKKDYLEVAPSEFRYRVSVLRIR